MTNELGSLLQMTRELNGNRKGNLFASRVQVLNGRAFIVL